LSRCVLPDNRVDHPLCMFVISLQNLYNKTEWCLSVCLKPFTYLQTYPSSPLCSYL
jgi:hypothetical protein